MISVKDYILKYVTTDLKKKGVNTFIKSPFTNERTPSFCIFEKTDSFFDYRSDFGGDVIELHRKLKGISKKQAYKEMINDEHGGGINLVHLLPHKEKKVEKSTFKVDKVIDLVNPGLISYFVNERKIHPDILKKYCKEMHYSVKGFNNKAVCFENNVGGYEIRSVKFKGGYGPKDVTFVKGIGKKHSDIINIFEGFTDFMSYLTLKGKLNSYYDTYVLNSVVFKDRIKVDANIIKEIRLYVDNDDAGQKAVDYYIALFGGIVKDMRLNYWDSNDLNEHLKKLI